MLLLLYGFFSVDPFAKKDWYDIKAPSVFTVKNVGKTLVTRTQGTKVDSPLLLLPSSVVSLVLFAYAIAFRIFLLYFAIIVC